MLFSTFDLAHIIRSSSLPVDVCKIAEFPHWNQLRSVHSYYPSDDQFTREWRQVITSPCPGRAQAAHERTWIPTLTTMTVVCTPLLIRARKTYAWERELSVNRSWGDKERQIYYEAWGRCAFLISLGDHELGAISQDIANLWINTSAGDRIKVIAVLPCTAGSIVWKWKWLDRWAVGGFESGPRVKYEYAIQHLNLSGIGPLGRFLCLLNLSVLLCLATSRAGTLLTQTVLYVESYAR